jgi:hypothetical protein
MFFDSSFCVIPRFFRHLLISFPNRYLSKQPTSFVQPFFERFITLSIQLANRLLHMSFARDSSRAWGSIVLSTTTLHFPSAFRRIAATVILL